MQFINGRLYNDDGEDITVGNITTGDLIVGDVGVVIKNATGPIHTGSGNVYTTTVVTGKGATVVEGDKDGNGLTIIAGDNHGGISHTFRSGKKRK